MSKEKSKKAASKPVKSKTKPISGALKSKSNAKVQAKSQEKKQDKVQEKVHEKSTGVKGSKTQDKEQKVSEKTLKQGATVVAKTESKSKTKKPKKSEETDPDDTLLADDDGMGGEELPDLADYETEEVEDSEEAIEEENSTADLSSSVTTPGLETEEEVVLTDAEGRRLCRVRDCDQAATVEAYCRFHYLQNWKRIQVRRRILADGKLERYVDELTSRYPDKFLEMIRKDLRTEKDFTGAIAELEIDESGLDNEFEDESQSFIDEVRGVSESASLSSDDDEY